MTDTLPCMYVYIYVCIYECRSSTQNEDMEDSSSSSSETDTEEEDTDDTQPSDINHPNNPTNSQPHPVSAHKHSSSEQFSSPQSNPSPQANNSNNPQSSHIGISKANEDMDPMSEELDFEEENPNNSDNQLEQDKLPNNSNHDNRVIIIISSDDSSSEEEGQIPLEPDDNPDNPNNPSSQPVERENEVFIEERLRDNPNHFNKRKNSNNPKKDPDMETITRYFNRYTAFDNLNNPNNPGTSLVISKEDNKSRMKGMSS